MPTRHPGQGTHTQSRQVKQDGAGQRPVSLSRAVPRDKSGAGSGAALGDVAHFDSLSEAWWDCEGPHRLLHRINPVRLSYIRRRLFDHFARPGEPTASDKSGTPGKTSKPGASPLNGLRILDVGCGGGLLCEPLARLGADVTGIDLGPRSIDVARRHAASQGLAITYDCCDVERVGRRHGGGYHAVLCMEVVEHVTDVSAFLGHCGALLGPGGLFIGSTLNRTLGAYVLAIVAAERLLGWLPVGTHRHDHFVRPHEFARDLRQGGLHVCDVTGMVFDPLAGDWRLSDNTRVNYFITASRPCFSRVRDDKASGTLRG